MHFKSETTSIWPPDWSAFLPDGIIAVFTGLFVGLVVLGVERRISHRRQQELTSRQQLDAVENLQRPLDKPFRYDWRLFVPVDDELSAVREAVAGVTKGPADPPVPGYFFLRAILSAWDDVKHAADPLPGFIRATGSLAPRQEPLVRDFVEDYVAGKITDWSQFGDGQPFVTAVNHSDFVQAVDHYREARRILDTTREAFQLADITWRGEAWKVALYQAKGAPVPVIPRLWRAIRVHFWLKRARTEADAAGQRLMIESGYPWFPPRAW